MKPLFLSLLLISTNLFAQTGKPAITILGVTHTGQLMSAAQQPAALRSFVERVNPNALLIERSPEEYARGDFYEFTYEQQFVLVPFAKQHNIPIHPIDWLPKEDDIRLAFGVQDLEVPAFTRSPTGFWGFTSFSDSSVLEQSLYYAEESSERNSNLEWYAMYPQKQVNADGARRLFLYRTFMQAKRIEAVAKNYTEQDTLLVVIGSLHKADIEAILSGAGYTIINSARFGVIAPEEIKRNYTTLDAFAIASFNLLGVQSRNNVTDHPFLQEAINHIKTVASPEAQFFATKYQLFTKKITAKEAIVQYNALLKTLPKTTVFTWTGVKNRARLDSYVDPFGNMTLWQRLHLELAREYFKTGDRANYTKEQNLLLAELQGLKKAMLISYMPLYIEK